MADFTNDDPRMPAALAALGKIPTSIRAAEPTLGEQVFHDVLVDAVVAVARALDVQPAAPAEQFDVEFTDRGIFVARAHGTDDVVMTVLPEQDPAEAAATYRRNAAALDAIAAEVASRGPVTRAADSLTAYGAGLTNPYDRRLVLAQVETIRAAIGDSLEL